MPRGLLLPVLRKGSLARSGLAGVLFWEDGTRKNDPKRSGIHPAHIFGFQVAASFAGPGKSSTLRIRKVPCLIGLEESTSLRSSWTSKRAGPSRSLFLPFTEMIIYYFPLLVLKEIDFTTGHIFSCFPADLFANGGYLESPRLIGAPQKQGLDPA